jgi:hypothetical protein
MPTIKHPYQPHKHQTLLHEYMAKHRFGVVVCHRRFGKTYWAVNALIHAALTAKLPNSRYAYIAPYYKQAKQVAWDYFKQFTHMIPNVQYNEAELRIDFPNGARIRLFGGDNPDALRGIYLDGVVLDEVADMRPNVWGEVIRPTLSDRIGWAVFIGTPKGIDLFYETYQKALVTDGWFAQIYRADETGIIPDSELTKARAEMTEQQYAQEFLCSFTTSTGNTLIPISLAVEASKRSLMDIDVQGGVRVLGVDVARYGDDRSVIFPVQGLKAYPPKVFSGVNNVDLARHVMATIDDFKPDYVRIDAGRGEGVIDYLRSHRYKCTEVNFGATPISNYYQNARAEMWHGLKKWLEAGGAIPEIPELLSELSAPEYHFSTANKLVLESKEKMKERGLRSPDYADALALAVGYPLKASSSGDATNVVRNKSTGLKTAARFENNRQRLRNR